MHGEQGTEREGSLVFVRGFDEVSISPKETILPGAAWPTDCPPEGRIIPSVHCLILRVKKRNQEPTVFVMRHMRPFLLLFFVVPAIAPAFGQSKLAIENVTLIDGTDRAPQRNVTVVVEGDKVSEIITTHIRAKLRDAKIIEGKNKFLIPGLWNNDLHAVNYDKAKAALRSLLSYGITSVRDMGAPLDDVIRLRADTASRFLRGPTIYAAGPLLEGPVPVQMPLIVDLFNERQAREEVRDLKRHDVDYVEVDTTLTPELYWVISDEVQRESLRLVGHIPPKIRADEVIKAHQENVEHLGGRFLNILVACSSEEQEFNRVLAATFDDLLQAIKEKRPVKEPQFTAAFDKKLLQTFDEQKAQQLFRLYAQNRVWQTPTLFVLRTLWDSNRDNLKLNEQDMDYGKKIFAKDMDIVLQMKRAGVPILARTDGQYSQGGDALHSELSLLVQAGLTPLEALQSATSDSAEFMGVSRTSGTIEPGKTADMVLLNANPLDDVANTRQIGAVVLRGKFFTKEELTAIPSR